MTRLLALALAACAAIGCARPATTPRAGVDAEAELARQRRVERAERLEARRSERAESNERSPRVAPVESISITDDEFTDEELAAQRKPTYDDPRQERMYRIWLNTDHPSPRVEQAHLALIEAIPEGEEAMQAALAEIEAANAELERLRQEAAQQARWEAEMLQRDLHQREEIALEEEKLEEERRHNQEQEQLMREWNDELRRLRIDRQASGPLVPPHFN